MPIHPGRTHQAKEDEPSRHTCPGCGGKRCFTLYIDENGEPVHPTVGRCDHESVCAYHYTPKEYFRDHPDAKPGHNWRVLTPEQRKRLFPQHKEPKPLCTIPSEYVTRSVRPTAYSHLTHFLQTIIDPVEATGIIHVPVATSQHPVNVNINIETFNNHPGATFNDNSTALQPSADNQKLLK